MRCGTRSPRTFCRAAAIYGRSRNCSATLRCRRRRSTPGSTVSGCWKCIVARIRAPEGLRSPYCSVIVASLNWGRTVMSAHESMEQAEHAEHASGENKKIALLIAVIALCLALSETIAKNVEASNLWAFFQAKSIRRTTVQTAAEQAKLAAPSDDAMKAAVQKQIDDWQKTAARYRSEPETGEGTEQLAERAKHAEEERDLATAKYHHFELASAAFQIGIVLASGTIITGIVALAWIAGLLTLTGVVFTALGIFAPHALHLAL